AQPGQVLQDAPGGLVRRAGLIGVLDTDHEAAGSPRAVALRLGEGPAEEGRPGPAYVKVPGRRRRKARDDEPLGLWHGPSVARGRFHPGPGGRPTPGAGLR